MNKTAILSIVAVTLLLMVAIPVIGDDSKAKSYADYESDEESDEKIICSATSEDDFADNKVLIVLNKEASLNFKPYTPKDFTDVGCSKVEDLTELTPELVRKQLAGEKKEYSEKPGELVIDGFSCIDVDKFRRILCLELTNNSKENVLKSIKQIEKRDDILWAGPDFVTSMCITTPNDPYLSQQWGVGNVQLKAAWDISTGSSAVTVGVLDTGIDGNHADLTNRINKSLCRDFTTGGTVTVTNPADPNGHGTHVAGIIGAQGNNRIGVAGVCWDVRIVSLRVLDANGNGYESNIARAIDFATLYGIPILNASLAGKSYDRSLEHSIKNYPGLFVCAAGNGNANTDYTPYYPSSLRLPNLISVGALTSPNKIAVPGVPGWPIARPPAVPYPMGSNYGATTVDIFAPGTTIYSTVPGGYQNYSGTSMASPYVAGVAALLLSKHPYSAVALKEIIMSSGTPESTLSNACVSGKQVNAYNALNVSLFAGGNGTSGSPYLVSNVQQLKNIEKLCSYDIYEMMSLVGADRHYKLTTNITLSGNWKSISDTSYWSAFSGTFDGNGKTISGLSINSSITGHFGLFAKSYGTIKNLTMSSVNININVGSNGPTKYVGAIAGLNCAVVDNCTVNGSIAVSGNGVVVGGLIGNNESHIKNSTNNATVTNNGMAVNDPYCATGGIAGRSYWGTIHNCNNNGAVTGNDRTGGITGYSSNSTISNCTTYASTNNVKYSWKTISSSNVAGGIVGETYYGEVKNCTFNGVIKYTNYASNSTTLQPKMGQIVGYSYKTTLTSNIGNGSVDKWTLRTVGIHDQALYAAQYGLYGQSVS